MKYALISVSNKANLETIADFLWQKGYIVLSTGGTYNYLQSHTNNPDLIRRVSDFTGAEELLEGRVKTLHPKIYAGILGNRCSKDDVEELINIVVVNLYPFQEIISREKCTEEEAVENIDIGGVSLLRAGGKNYKHVLTITDPGDYVNIIRDWDTIDISARRYYAGKAFKHVTAYDMAISQYFDSDMVYRAYVKVKDLKYGCNPHQLAAVYKYDGGQFPFRILNGTMGYINYMDALLSWSLVEELHGILKVPCCASFKHNAPAGVGTSRPISEILRKTYMVSESEELSPGANAFIRARQTDPMSSFGDFIAMSVVVEEDVARLIKREVSDGIIAPGYTERALELLTTKKQGRYIVIETSSKAPSTAELDNSFEYRELCGAVLGQSRNTGDCSKIRYEDIVTERKGINVASLSDAMIAMVATKYTPSNSVVFAYDGQVIGVGAGQQNRVDCVRLAAHKAEVWFLRQHSECINLQWREGLKRQDKVNAIVSYIRTETFAEYELTAWRSNFVKLPPPLTSAMKREFMNDISGVVVSSDGFFPFRDSIDECSKFGVSYVVQPGGSVADDEVTKACDQYGMVMFCSGLRLFSH